MFGCDQNVPTPVPAPQLSLQCQPACMIYSVSHQLPIYNMLCVWLSAPDCPPPAPAPQCVQSAGSRGVPRLAANLSLLAVFLGADTGDTCRAQPGHHVSRPAARWQSERAGRTDRGRSVQVAAPEGNCDGVQIKCARCNVRSVQLLGVLMLWVIAKPGSKKHPGAAV